jgi:hypothetical protein
MRLALVLASLLAVSPVSGQGGPSAAAKIYAVIFQVQVDTAGKVTSLKIDHVIDPALPGPPDDVTKRAVNVPVPETYLSAVRASLNRHGYDGSKRSFYTYTFFDPARPTDPDPEPGK